MGVVDGQLVVRLVLKNDARYRTRAACNIFSALCCRLSLDLPRRVMDDLRVRDVRFGFHLSDMCHLGLYQREGICGTWYEQCVIPCIWGLAFLGLQRHVRAGRSLAILMVLTTGWIAIATYLAKLLPFYGGYEGRSTVPAIFHWWTHGPANALSGVVLGPVSLLFLLLGVFLVLLITLTVKLVPDLTLSAGA